MRKTSNLLIRLVLLCTALCIIGLGGALFLFSNLGSDPYNLLAQGLSGVTGLKIGTINTLMQLSIFVFLLIVWREKIGIGTLFATFLIGGSLNVWYALLERLIGDPNMFIRIICVVSASFVIGFGVALVQLTDLGMVPNDILPIYIHNKLGRFQFRIVRIFYDSVQLVLGVLLGGVLGVGTVLCALLTGPAIQASLGLLSRFGGEILHVDNRQLPSESAQST